MQTQHERMVRVFGGAMAPPARYADADIVLFFDTFGDCTAAVLWDKGAWHFLPRATESAMYPTIGPGEGRRVVLLAGAIELPAMRAVTVEFHDAEGLTAVAYGQFTDDFWIYATRADGDWKQHLLRIGTDGVLP